MHYVHVWKQCKETFDFVQLRHENKIFGWISFSQPSWGLVLLRCKWNILWYFSKISC